MQVKLLRVLDGASYYRVGGVKKVTVDVRLVAATNQDLKLAVRGRFRSDLYHRLSQIPICVPPLRDRRNNIAPLAVHYLAQQNSGHRFSEPVLDKLRGYPWPGNIRELRNVVMRACVFARVRKSAYRTCRRFSLTAPSRRGSGRAWLRCRIWNGERFWRRSRNREAISRGRR